MLTGQAHIAEKDDNKPITKADLDAAVETVLNYMKDIFEKLSLEIRAGSKQMSSRKTL
jgi:hypothetical protein